MEYASEVSKEECFRAMFEQAGVGLAVVGLDGRCLLVNDLLCAITGHTREDLLRRRFRYAVSPYSDGLTPDYDRRLLDVRRSRERRLLEGAIELDTYRTRYLRKNDGPIWIECAVRILRAPTGAPTHFYWSVQAITRPTRLEATRQRMRDAERRRIARDLHDYVLPDLMYAQQSLQIVRGRTQDSAVSAELGQGIDGIRQAVQGLRGVIYDARTPADGERPFVHLLDALVELIRRSEPQLDIRVTVQEAFPAEIPAAASIDILRIVREAIVNAWRHAAARSIAVTAGGDDDEAWLTVVDDGRGFDRATIVDGMGLGSMDERARLLGGEIQIETAPGSGTRIRLRIPRERLQDGRRRRHSRLSLNEAADAWSGLAQMS